MELDFAEILLEVMERDASDLHLTAGSPPMIRHHGRLHAMDQPRLTPQMTREVIYSILTNDQRQRLETDWQIDLAYSIPSKARFRVNAYFQRASLAAAFRLIRQCGRSAPLVPQALHVPGVLRTVVVQVPHGAAAGLDAPVLAVAAVGPPAPLDPPPTDHVGDLVAAATPLEPRGHPGVALDQDLLVVEPLRHRRSAPTEGPSRTYVRPGG